MGRNGKLVTYTIRRKKTALLFLPLNLSVYNYHNEGKQKPGLKSPDFSNQTRSKASCKFLAAFVKSPPFLQLQRTFQIRLLITFGGNIPLWTKYTFFTVRLEVKVASYDQNMNR